MHTQSLTCKVLVLPHRDRNSRSKDAAMARCRGSNTVTGLLLSPLPSGHQAIYCSRNIPNQTHYFLPELALPSPFPPILHPNHKELFVPHLIQYHPDSISQPLFPQSCTFSHHLPSACQDDSKEIRGVLFAFM